MVGHKITSVATAEQLTSAGKKKQGRASTPSMHSNPLLWLSRHKDKSGRALIGPAAYIAGERLKSDIVMSRMLPTVTMNWSQAQHVDKSRRTGSLNPSEASLAARQRMNKAMTFVGPEFSGILIDLCGFDKGLETMESERHWPARSGKLVIRLALDCLARYYGYADEAYGSQSRAIVGWQEHEPGNSTVLAHPAKARNTAAQSV